MKNIYQERALQILEKDLKSHDYLDLMKDIVFKSILKKDKKHVIVRVIVKELLGAEYRPKDQTNDASDDLSDITSFIRRNMKSDFQKQLNGDD